eukprot:CAMPEP_0201284524 /NCGR_PEP_ID=MMETSP1317-20130820/76862_1 /ASSEMBLY_ACC=CAM_ASM_000770 /TAXON_ID=187299 /ORGANISM="Undescribed Undescribed, Strain Undescribed" /LENGTH=135 /DNA_ID=CAMNT_0047605037 /DNA_START=68 /DNA_END=472 /DNA_ORIENTATION=-
MKCIRKEARQTNIPSDEGSDTKPQIFAFQAVLEISPTDRRCRRSVCKRTGLPQEHPGLTEECQESRDSDLPGGAPSVAGLQPQPPHPEAGAVPALPSPTGSRGLPPRVQRGDGTCLRQAPLRLHGALLLLRPQFY